MYSVAATAATTGEYGGQHMLKEIKMPGLGTNSSEINIIRWLKQEGSSIVRGEPLLEVETDKSAMEVESYLAGFLKKIVSPEGSTVSTGDVIAYIGDEADAVPEDAGPPAQSEAVQEQASEEITEQESVRSEAKRVSPMVQNLAKKLGVDLSKVTGTGINGNIMKSDVENAAKSAVPQDDPPPTGLQPFNVYGRATARSMTESKATIPHVYYSVDCSPQSLIDARGSSEKRISYNAMIIRAVAAAIRKFPRAAATYTPEGALLPENVNIGLAVDTDGDLVVPVIKQADKKTIFEIEEELSVLIEKAQNKKLRPDDIAGGIFTVSNLGAMGVDAFYAVIKPGESGILAISRMRKEPVVTQDSIVPGLRMHLGLSQDHRVVNGAYSAAFLSKIKEELETWKI